MTNPNPQDIDMFELRRLVNEYGCACENVRGHAVPQWRNIVAHVLGIMEAKTAASETNLQTAVQEAWRANALLTRAAATLSDLVQFFDEWEQIIPQDARAALALVVESARVSQGQGKP